MSIPVELSDLQAKTTEYTWAYLLTVRADATPHLVSLAPQWSGGSMYMSVSVGTGRNAAAGSTVTLCFPPPEHDAYSLIIDGSAAVIESGSPGGESASESNRAATGDSALDPVPDGKVLLRFEPTGAVLHRSAEPGFKNSATGCANDCLPVEAPTL